MISTMGVQPFNFSKPSPYLLIEGIDDVLKYLDQEIVIRDNHAFLDRDDISLDGEFGGTAREKQYYANGLLITGLFEELDNEKFFEVEKRFEEMIATISSLLGRRLRAEGLEASHSVFVEKDEGYGDIVIGFWRNGSE
ncbi:hypothetical protein [Henriciella litoralis]|uniref:hypothetical protein n=1 Tax=Henriciella litoralis TaxID=568102 RepID=UPI0009FCABBA|nr:hypothetical protein [Henriciella litoralis]